MGFLNKLINDAAEELKKKAEEAKNQMLQNVKSQLDDILSNNNSANGRSSFSLSVDSDGNDVEDEEPKICLGKFENGVLIISEGFTKLDDESMEDYKHVRKVIFPASLEKLDEDVFSETNELEELDFSQVSKLEEIPEDLVSCKTKIAEFVIPQGVKKVGDGFLCEAKAGTKIFVPDSVKQLGYINGNDDNDLYIYLFASGIDLDDVERDVNTLYVLPKDYADYAEKLKECDSEAKLRNMPEELIGFYSKGEVNAPKVQPASASVLPDSSPVAEKKTSQGVFSDRLEAMIEAALQDGVLTQKEKEVILRRAEKEGEDLDEFEFLFDARLSQLGIKVEVSTTEEPSDIQTPEMPENDSAKGPDGMFSERLEFLIHNAIEDGQITEKERNVIIRRAQAEGEDLDEVDVYIQSLLQKKKMGEL